jgi:hypothetical protein
VGEVGRPTLGCLSRVLREEPASRRRRRHRWTLMELSRLPERHDTP